MNSAILLFAACLIGGASPENPAPKMRVRPIVQFIANSYTRNGKAVKHLLERIAGRCEDDSTYYVFQDIVANFDVRFTEISDTDLRVLDDIPRVAVGKTILGRLPVCGCGCALFSLRRMLWRHQLEMLSGQFCVDQGVRNSSVRYPTEYERTVARWIKTGKVENGFEIICPMCSGRKKGSAYCYAWVDARFDKCPYCGGIGKKRIWMEDFP